MDTRVNNSARYNAAKAMPTEGFWKINIRQPNGKGAETAAGFLLAGCIAKADLIQVKNGKAKAVLIVSSDASGTVREAAQDLSRQSGVADKLGI